MRELMTIGSIAAASDYGRATAAPWQRALDFAHGRMAASAHRRAGPPPGSSEWYRLMKMRMHGKMGAIAMGQIGDVAGDAAIAMNNALIAHGYKASDMPIYQAFHDAAGVAGNAYPGAAMMNALANELAAIGVTMTTVPHYPWLAGPGYDGINAPTSAEWYGGAVLNVSPTVIPGTVPQRPAMPGKPAWYAAAESVTTTEVVLGLGAAGIAAYFLARALKRKKGARRARPAHALLMF
jgi:hypothetical protein